MYPIARDILFFWKQILQIVAPLVALPLIIIEPSREKSCGYVMLVMALFWMFELLPLAITAMFPIFLFPFLGVLGVGETCAQYLKHSNFLLLGGIFVALAVEETGLHKRIALKALLLVGYSISRQMLGFMLVTSTLSMWISNTATTALMLPIAKAVCEEILAQKHGGNKRTANNQDLLLKDDYRLGKEDASNASQFEEEPISPHLDPIIEPRTSYLNPNRFAMLPPEDQAMVRWILLSICYAANIGGVGTITGTMPNIISLGQINEFAMNTSGMKSDLSYANWILFAVPILICCVSIAWLWLQLLCLGWRNTLRSGINLFKCKRSEPERSFEKTSENAIKLVLEHEYKELGRINFGEISIGVVFLTLVLLWMFRSPKFIPGWEDLFTHKDLFNDASVVMMISCFLFLWPIKVPDFFFLKSTYSQRKRVHRGSLLNWKAVHEKFPWDVILLSGGGFALAIGVQESLFLSESGLSNVIGTALQTAFASMHPAIIVLIAVVVVTFATELCSNAATTTIFTTVLIPLAVKLNLNPMYLVLPTTVAASFAFMLPVGTPPNAIVYGTGLIKLPDMVRTGFVLNVLCICVVLIASHTWMWSLFNFGSFPAWALQLNSTIESSI